MVTRNPFIVYSSNVTAMLGLRSLYFVLADALRGFATLRHGMVVLLVFMATKMLRSAWIPSAACIGAGDCDACCSRRLRRRSSRVSDHSRLNIIGPLARAELDDGDAASPRWQNESSRMIASMSSWLCPPRR